MMIRNLQRVLSAMALVMVILVAAPAGGPGQLLYFCAMTGQLGARCCCKAEASQDTASSASLTVAPCCEIVGADEGLAPAAVKLVSPRLKPPQFVAVPCSPNCHRRVLRTVARFVLPHGSRGSPPGTGPPTFIRHCSFLI